MSAWSVALVFSVDLLRARTTSATLVAWDLPARSLFPLDISGSLRYTSFASSFLIGRSVCFIASYQRRGFLSSFLSLLRTHKPCMPISSHIDIVIEMCSHRLELSPLHN